jgi:hypothetical protein
MGDDFAHIVDLVRPFVPGNGTPTIAEIDQAFARLEELGLVCRTGEFRKGKPVFVATELGLTVQSAPATRQ